MLCRKLKEKFNLNEEIDKLEMSFKGTHYDNSEMEEFNLTLDFDKEIERIQEITDNFKTLIANESAEDCRQAYFRKNNKKLSQEKQEKMAEIFQQRKALVARILNFYFKKLSHNGININETFLQLVGFRPCSCC